MPELTATQRRAMQVVLENPVPLTYADAILAAGGSRRPVDKLWNDGLICDAAEFGLPQELVVTHAGRNAYFGCCELPSRIAKYPNGGHPLVTPQCQVAAKCQVRKLMEVEK